VGIFDPGNPYKGGMNKSKNMQKYKNTKLSFFNMNGRVRETRQTLTNKNAKIK
jgi:hypothetical protein